MPDHFFPSNAIEFISSHNVNPFLPLPTMPVPPDTDGDIKANANDSDEYNDFPDARYNTDTYLDKVSRDDERDCYLQDS